MFCELFTAAIVCYVVAYIALICILDCDLRLAFYEKFGKPISSLAGKVVFITGASSGIGEYTALTLAKHGVKLALAARRLDELERVKKTCIEISAGKLTDKDVLAIQMDVTNFARHKQYFDEAVNHFGTVDILFNNAGRSQRAFFEDVDLSVDKDMFDLNVFAVINLSRVAVNYFKTKGRGQIAVNTSVTGVIGFPFSCTYTATKHALHGYFNSLRAEKNGKGISVNIFCPGPTFSNFLQNCYTDRAGEKYGVAAKPTDRRMTTERCAELCSLGMANDLNESWMGLYPMLPMLYIYVFCPNLYNMALQLFGTEKVFKMRDSKANIVKEK